MATVRVTTMVTTILPEGDVRHEFVPDLKELRKMSLKKLASLPTIEFLCHNDKLKGNIGMIGA